MSLTPRSDSRAPESSNPDLDLAQRGEGSEFVLTKQELREDSVANAEVEVDFHASFGLQTLRAIRISKEPIPAARDQRMPPLIAGVVGRRYETVGK